MDDTSNKLEGAGRLIYALDVAALDEAVAQVERLRGVVSRFKVGLELFSVAGPRAVDAVRSRGAGVFLDLKMHDIPETVRRATRAAASTGAEMVTVHAAGGPAMLAAAVMGAREGGKETRVLAVTVLTSLGLEELEAAGTVTPTVEDLVVRRARLAHASGCDGVVASPLEARAVRAAVGAGFLIVTPGVRASPVGGDDQKRTGSARQAIADGADAVVVGRPIRDALDPVAAARALAAELATL